MTDWRSLNFRWTVRCLCVLVLFGSLVASGGCCCLPAWQTTAGRFSAGKGEVRVEKKVFHNLNLTVTPILDQLKSQDLSDTVTFLLQSLEFNLTNMFSSFGANLAKDGHTMTPREIRICEMIRSGLSSKQMAKVLGISPQTVLVHRKNNRKKLGLAKSKKNLASFLKVNL